MKKYINMDFDEKGNAILGTARTTPASNGFVPTTWTPGGGNNKHGILSVTAPAETDPPLNTLFPIYHEDLPPMEDGAFDVRTTTIDITTDQSWDDVMVTVTPTKDWYAGYESYDDELVFGEKGQPLEFRWGDLPNQDFFAADRNSFDSVTAVVDIHVNFE